MSLSLPITAGASGAMLEARVKSAGEKLAPGATESTASTESLKEFEAVFASLLIKEMRKSAEGLFPGDSSDSLGVLFDNHIGNAVAEGGSLGIAQQLARYMEAKSHE